MRGAFSLTRPPINGLAREIPLGLAFSMLAAVALALTRLEGGVAFVWIATALLFARLSLLPTRRWGAALTICGVASVMASCAFGLGARSAIPLAILIVAEAAASAWLLRRWLRGSAYFETPRGVAAFALVAGLLVPAVTGLASGALLAALFGQPLGSAWLGWTVAHGLGTIVFAPILMLVMRGEVHSWFGAATRAQRWGALALLAAVALVSLGVFGQSRMPLLFLPMLPIMAVTMRLGRSGAAASIVILAGVGSACTFAGTGPIFLIAGTQGQRLQFFQLYLAATTMLVLPVAALLKQNADLLRRLSDSEARFRLITERSGDAILNLGIDGTVLYASPAISQLGGFSPAAIVGRKALDFIHVDDHDRVVETHRRAMAHPASGFSVEYRALTQDGAERWFETSTRAVIDGSGVPTGAISAIRDVTHRKATEAQLSAAAHTDWLTGLPNRRAFNTALEARLAEVRLAGGAASLAMFDIDWFKAVNDRYGHDAGDAVLVAFAQDAKRALREGDLLARIGGEEFALLLAPGRIEQAGAVCERLRARFSASAVRLESGVSIRITLSAGVAVIGPCDDAASVLRAADAALYRAKAEGRDRLVLAA